MSATPASTDQSGTLAPILASDPASQSSSLFFSKLDLDTRMILYTHMFPKTGWEVWGSGTTEWSGFFKSCKQAREEYQYAAKHRMATHLRQLQLHFDPDRKVQPLEDIKYEFDTYFKDDQVLYDLTLELPYIPLVPTRIAKLFQNFHFGQLTIRLPNWQVDKKALNAMVHEIAGQYSSSGYKDIWKITITVKSESKGHCLQLQDLYRPGYQIFRGGDTYACFWVNGAEARMKLLKQPDPDDFETVDILVWD